MNYYRLIDEIIEEGVRVRVQVWNVYRTTPCGVWVIRPYAPHWWDFKTLRRNGYLKWIGNTSGRKYCYPELSDAINSYKRRKDVQHSKLTIQMEQCGKVLSEFETIKTATLDELKSGLNLGETPSIQRLIFL